MSSQWLNKKAIMRDLSLAQGVVPVAVAGAVEAGDRPPALNIKEETEEAFFHEWVGGDGEFSAPDIGMIQHMLEVVRNHESPVTENNDDSPVTDKSDKDDDHVIQIEKLNPLCPEFKPRVLASGDNAANKTNETKPKKKRLRNAALQSLLQNMKENIVATDNKQIKVLGTENIKKVTDWLKIQPVKPPSPTKNNAPMLDLDSTSVFKKKKASEAKTELVKEAGWMKMQSAKTPSPTKKNAPMLDIDPTSMFKKKKALEVKPQKVKEVKKMETPPYKYTKYVPSENAAEYYKKFLQCSEMHQMVQENVWTKVERQMKEIDERRKAEAELLSLSLALSAERDDAIAVARALEPEDAYQRKLSLVQLPSHRHSLPAPCKLCALVRNLRACANNTQLSFTREHAPPVDEHVVDNWRKDREAVEDSEENVSDNWRKGKQTVEADDKVVTHSWRKDNDNEDNAGNKDRNEAVVEVDDKNVDDNWQGEMKPVVDQSEKTADGKTVTDENDNDVDNTCYDDDINVVEEHEKNDDNSTRDQNGTVMKRNDNDDNSWMNLKPVAELVDEDITTWMTPLDDEEEIDAWRTEILGDDEDENQCIELVNNTDDNTAQCLKDDEEKWQNENHIEAVCYNIEKWQSVLLGRDENDFEKVEKKTEVNENEFTTEEFDLKPDNTNDIQPFHFEITKPLENDTPSTNAEIKSYRQFQINARKNHSGAETYDIFTNGPLFGYERMRYKNVKVDGEYAYEPVYDERTAWHLLMESLEDLNESDVDLEEFISS